MAALVHSDNATLCTELERHAKDAFRRVDRALNYSARCGVDFHQSGAMPGADVYLWWQQQKFWQTGAILTLLRDLAARGALRPRAEALVMFDLTQWRDAGGASIEASTRSTPRERLSVGPASQHR